MSWSSGTSFDPPGTAAAALHSPAQASLNGAATPDDEASGRKRKRASIGTPNGEDSPASKARHQPGVKRACNDCRQQKVGISRPGHWTMALCAEREETRTAIPPSSMLESYVVLICFSFAVAMQCRPRPTV